MLNDRVPDVSVILKQITEESLTEIIESSEMEPYRSAFIRSMKKSANEDSILPPKALAEKATQSTSSFKEAADKYMKAEILSKEHSAAYSDMLSNIIKRDKVMSGVSGFNRLQDSTEYNVGISIEDFAKIDSAIDVVKDNGKSPIIISPIILDIELQKNKYSIDEAIEITIAVLNKVEPSLGSRFEKCLENGRALIKEGSNISAHTIPGEYNQEEDKFMPPFFEMSFDGSLLSLLMMVHEAAHVVHLDISAEHNFDKRNFLPPIFVLENFSHFAELMLKQELQERDGSEMQKAAIEGFFQHHLVEGMRSHHVALFEKDLYDQLESGKEEFSFKEVHAAYEKSGKKIYGNNWEPKASPDLDSDFQSFLNVSWSMGHPLQLGAYLGNHAAAYAMIEKRNENPEEFGKNFVAAMEAGGKINFEELMDSYFGEGAYRSENIFEQGMAEWKKERDKTLDKIDSLAYPNVPRSEKLSDLAKLTKSALTSSGFKQGEASADKIADFLIKYEPMFYRDQAAQERLRQLFHYMIEKAQARDDRILGRSEILFHEIDPSTGVSPAYLEAMDFTDAAKRGETEILEHPINEYRSPSEKAYEIADGLVYDPGYKLVHYNEPDSEAKRTCSPEDYSIKRDDGSYETAADLINRIELKNKPIEKRNPLVSDGSEHSI